MSAAIWIAVFITAMELVALAVRHGGRPVATRPRAASSEACPPSSHHGTVLAGLAMLVATALVAPGPLLVAVLLAAFGATLVVRRRRHRRAGDGSPASEGLSVAAELLAIGLTGGVGLLPAVDSVARQLHGPVAQALAEVSRRHESGEPVRRALHEALVPLGPAGRRLALLLHDHHDYGARAAGPLRMLADDLRRTHRQAVEIQARQLPVRMLGPLLLCVLPAFLLLTVVPIVIEGLRSVNR